MSHFPYEYVRALQLENNWPEDVGCWGRTIFRIGYGEGWPLSYEKVEFVSSVAGPLPELPKADPESFVKTGAYLPIRSLDDAIRYPRFTLAETLSVGCYQNHSWSTNRKTGKLSAPVAGEPLNEDSHGLLIVGMNKLIQLFRFRNTWGEEWGDRGFGTMPFSYFDEYVFEAYTPLMPWEEILVTNVQSEFGTVRISAFEKIVGLSFFFASLKVDGKTVGWAFAKDSPSRFEIYELFVWPEHRNKGIATALLEALFNTLILRPKQQRFLLVPFSDSKLHAPDTVNAIPAIAGRLGLKFSKPTSNFDCYLVSPDGDSTRPLEPRRIPPRPKSTLQALEEFVARSQEQNDETIEGEERRKLREINPERFDLAKKVAAATASEEEKSRFEELQNQARKLLQAIAPLNFELSDLPELEERMRRPND